MHMHLVAFQVLDRQPITVTEGGWMPAGGPVPPAPEEAGWKDTVAVLPREAVRVIARFDDFVGRFAYHCHVLEHEDHEMMRQFETTTVCGDGVRGLPAEACDDGNVVAGDGCSPTCQLEHPGGSSGSGGCSCGTGVGLDAAAAGAALVALAVRRRRRAACSSAVPSGRVP